jgi:hypothetical protein
MHYSLLSKIWDLKRIKERNKNKGIRHAFHVFYNPLEKIFPGKIQVEDDGENTHRRGSSGFGNAGLIEQAADFKFGKKNC